MSRAVVPADAGISSGGGPSIGETPACAGVTASFSATAVRLAGSCAVVLGWSPDAFWSATPAEVAAVVAALSPPAAAPPGRDVIDRLKEAFPDG